MPAMPPLSDRTKLFLPHHGDAHGEPSNGDVSCGGFEPNGDNNVAYRIYKWNEGCGVQGGWNDANNTMNYTGWVICSTNDC